MQTEHIERLSKLEERAKSNTRRIDAMEDILEEIRSLSSSTRELAVELKHLSNNMTMLHSKVEELENIDAEKFREYSGHIIKVLIGILIGAVGSGLLQSLHL